MEQIKTLASAEFQAKAIEAPGPVIVDFYQASCAPCRVLEPRLARVAEQYRDAVPVYRVDVDLDLPIAKRFGVMSLPTVLVLHAGREVERLDGLITDSDLKAAFEYAVRRNGRNE
jgi:thioredoxin 1